MEAKFSVSHGSRAVSAGKKVQRNDQRLSAMRAPTRRAAQRTTTSALGGQPSDGDGVRISAHFSADRSAAIRRGEAAAATPGSQEPAKRERPFKCRRGPAAHSDPVVLAENCVQWKGKLLSLGQIHCEHRYTSRIRYARPRWCRRVFLLTYTNNHPRG